MLEVSTQTRGRRNKWQERMERLKAVHFLPLCSNSKKRLEIFSASISRSTPMFLWRKKLQIHEHRLGGSAADILEQVDDLMVFVCHSSRAGLCLCVF